MSSIMGNIVIQHCHLFKINDALKENHLIHQNCHVIQIYVYYMNMYIMNTEGFLFTLPMNTVINLVYTLRYYG